MGLHLNVPQANLPDAAMSEHRRRIWWTAYTFDRMWSAKLGFPHSTSGIEAQIDLPSNVLAPVSKEDFPDPSHFVAGIGLAQLSSRILESIYGYASQKTSLSERVYSSFRDLQDWMDRLPKSLKMDNGQARSDLRSTSLQLSFNQLLILATRPILLHVLRTSLGHSLLDSQAEVPQSAARLAEACIRCARHSFTLLSESWINGSFMIFDYFDTQFLFSSASILTISVVWDRTANLGDKDRIECIEQFLWQLKLNGNFAAAEFHQHVAAILPLVGIYEVHRLHQPGTGPEMNDDISKLLPSNPSVSRTEPSGSEDISWGVALAEPLFQDLLAQPATDLQFIDEASLLDPDLNSFWYDQDK